MPKEKGPEWHCVTVQTKGLIFKLKLCVRLPLVYKRLLSF